ncbi:MAG: GNAT family N-acetyltransferase [Planctomycetes bacterium]|nr:GNAT family N-acetyltransferase [Planctomycetota bacterium]
MDAEFREYDPFRDSEAARVLLNAVFTSAAVSPEGWARWTAQDFTAPVAIVDGQIVGAIPLFRRSYRVAPGAEVTAWVENRVGVAEPLRDQGLGSGMQAAAKQFLQGRGDVLLVYRGAERTKGYRFYEKNGLYDVSYPLAATIEPANEAAPGTRWVTQDEFLAHSALWHDIFTACYGRFGGYPARHPGYLRDIIGTVTWQEAMRQEFSYAVVEDGGRAAGYMVLGLRKDVFQVMELAVLGGSVELARRLLAAARGRGGPVRCYATHGCLLAAAVRRLGAKLPPRENGAMMLMVHVLDIASTGRKVWRDVSALRDVEVRVWTPEREGVIHSVAAPKRALAIELKEHMLARLLMRRLDVARAVAEERVTLCGDEPGDAEALSDALDPCHWVYHPIDYL